MPKKIKIKWIESEQKLLICNKLVQDENLTLGEAITLLNKEKPNKRKMKQLQKKRY